MLYGKWDCYLISQRVVHDTICSNHLTLKQSQAKLFMYMYLILEVALSKPLLWKLYSIFWVSWIVAGGIGEEKDMRLSHKIFGRRNRRFAYCYQGCEYSHTKWKTGRELWFIIYHLVLHLSALLVEECCRMIVKQYGCVCVLLCVFPSDFIAFHTERCFWKFTTMVLHFLF